MQFQNLMAFLGGIPGAALSIAFWTAIFIAMALITYGLTLVVFQWLEGFFQSFVGYSNNTDVTSSKADQLLSNLINNNMLRSMFYALLAAAVVLLIFATILKIIRSEMVFDDKGGGNSKSKIYRDALKSLAMFIIVPVMCIFGIWLATLLLGIIYKMFASGAAAATTNLSKEYNFLSGSNLEDVKAIETTFNKILSGKDCPLYAMTTKAIDDFLLGIGGVAGLILTPFVSAGMLAVPIRILLGACVGVISRIYELVVLLLISPPVVGIMPLDDGNAFKQWKEKFIGKVLSMYGVVISVNAVIMITKLILKDSVTKDYTNLLSDYNANGLYQYIIIVAGLASVKSISSLLSGIFSGGKGTADILAAGEGAGGDKIFAQMKGDGKKLAANTVKPVADYKIKKKTKEHDEKREREFMSNKDQDKHELTNASDMGIKTAAKAYTEDTGKFKGAETTLKSFGKIKHKDKLDDDGNVMLDEKGNALQEVDESNISSEVLKTHEYQSAKLNYNKAMNDRRKSTIRLEKAVNDVASKDDGYLKEVARRFIANEYDHNDNIQKKPKKPGVANSDGAKQAGQSLAGKAQNNMDEINNSKSKGANVNDDNADGVNNVPE